MVDDAEWDSGSTERKPTCPVRRDGEEPTHLFAVGAEYCFCGAARRFGNTVVRTDTGVNGVHLYIWTRP